MDVKIESSWKDLLQDEFEKPYFLNLIEFVRREYKCNPGQIFPKGSQIFRAFNTCAVSDVKVVILGQDPYPTRGHAHGLCFSVDKHVNPLPKSLNNIYAELRAEGFDTQGRNGDLNHWAEQGVMLLNAVLTVREGQPESHSGKGWEQFTDAAIEELSMKRSGIVYLLWGSKAQQKARVVDADSNLILNAPHPSPLSAHRGFFGCGHFSKTNDYLRSKGIKPIKW